MIRLKLKMLWQLISVDLFIIILLYFIMIDCVSSDTQSDTFCIFISLSFASIYHKKIDN